jgi:hypothetical protein
MGKTLSGSVGKGGKNRREEVVTVQYLLNCVPKGKGGPEQELVIDGLCGPLTEAAIVRFQSTALGFADGRVDPGGKTFSALLNYDPYPNQKLNLPPKGPESKQGAKWGGTPSSNSWDPWGYHNPASKNYHVPGKEPGHKTGAGGHKDTTVGHKWSPGGKSGMGGPAGGIQDPWAPGGIKGEGTSGAGMKEGGISGKF